MNAEEELVKLIMESYDRGVEDAKQAALVTIAQVVYAEREACARVCDDKNTLLAWPTYAAAIRARGNT